MGKKQLRLIFLLFLLSLFLFFLDRREWLGSAKGWLTKPFLAVEEKIYNFRFFVCQEDQKELRHTLVEQSQLSLCLEENEKLRKLLGAPLPPTWKFLPAKVIGLTEYLKINQGEKEGVGEKMMVISENILVGQVVMVEAHDSFVQLPTAQAGKIPVIIRKSGEKGIQARGILEGHSGGLLLDKVLQAEDIRQGDLVVTAGGEDWLPDLLIGQIDEVLVESAAVYKKARVTPLLDYQQLRLVFVVL